MGYKLEDLNFVLADLGGKGKNPTVWNLYPSLEKAEEARQQMLKKDHDDNKYFSERNYKAMSFDEYTKKHKEFYLKGNPKKITEEKYYDMLNCLPPKRFFNYEKFQTFMMSEMLAGTITAQYLHDKKKNEYWEVNVDIKDQNTFLEYRLELMKC